MKQLRYLLRIIMFLTMNTERAPVSYTHLDVYKRQMYLCLKLRPVWPMQNLLQFEQFSLYTPGRSNLFCALGMRFDSVCSVLLVDCLLYTSFVFVCLYISNCSRVSSFRPFVCMCRMFMLLLMFLYMWFASMRWFAKVDSVVVWRAFVCSMYLCLKQQDVNTR